MYFYFRDSQLIISDILKFCNGRTQPQGANINLLIVDLLFKLLFADSSESNHKPQVESHEFTASDLVKTSAHLKTLCHKLHMGLQKPTLFSKATTHTVS